MLLQSLELRDFRSYHALDLSLSPGTTVLVGANGQGKTNLLEAIGYLATLDSFRGANDAALVRDGCEVAVIRAEGSRDDRRLTIEAEIHRSGRNRMMVNRQPLRRARDLLGALRVTVFSPDDLELVKGTPASRRRFVDDLAVALDPPFDTRRGEFDRILRQRNALLKQAKGRLTDDVAVTLDVWDTKFAAAGTVIGECREKIIEMLRPELSSAYGDFAGPTRRASARYAPTWSDIGLASALAASREHDLRRGVTTVGPHRDEVDLTLGGDPARTHGSQGEQRSLALALRLGAHRLVTDSTGSPPILLLDDVFSELDASRRTGLLAHLPHGQTIITTAADVPEETDPDLVMQVRSGTIHH
ncbi:MAG: DNA replication/repair protein RecF [Actinobacteria bacterium]|nr:DNA replication/repair protein RecF [Actinomycetota bacterium]